MICLSLYPECAICGKYGAHRIKHSFSRKLKLAFGSTYTFLEWLTSTILKLALNNSEIPTLGGKPPKEKVMQEKLDQLYEGKRKRGKRGPASHDGGRNEKLSYLETGRFDPAGGQYTPRPFLEDEFWYHEDEEWSNS